MEETARTGKNYTAIIVTLSLVVNAIILGLFFLPIGYGGEVKFDIHIFPRINAVLNSFTFVFLVIALVSIIKKNVKLHKGFILAAFTTTLLFCVSYLTYHYMSGETTRFGGEGFIRNVYFFILITHSFLAAIIVPLALFSLVWGWTGQLTKHRRIVRWSMPIWLYVSFTGVIVYLMISPYY
ncbi:MULTISPECIES: DUF420 domain-containing protein [Metabacillus]|jgi:putative membrane protein|uniref:DUF420 domain-containing protein n=1 Tax=Metabacillus hrfriensis TaxID=3048891 RepID=A0ACD4RFG2_9BACI|nr:MULTISPECIES: DUF420 domain-containing protein [Metabacillus]UAL53716.1 DUF420 domain-containing protein [Metabacillus dongyingensis]UOK59149.1 DUF420 domain-containing protein [Bacillus sp. OVS6]USK30026.1 DUF420 domain-containing protein [Bacillus sp. CMF21]WHZ59270.1 DUF420 domain-containing protein [Metabacillus sp. CT-WN-B3]